MEAVVIRWPRRRGWVTMTVPACEVHVGDRIHPRVPMGARGRPLRVVEVRDYSSELPHVPTLCLIIVAGRNHVASLYLRDEVVTVERRSRRR